ncbi:outer membrane protein assembly factor BamC [Tatumella saanichensis]|uniref:outer membrane protein assembly factor BamC n=1 Tax=Tatumella saanichensis TaxID=480813 RepID=UPI0004A2D51D|nr:outer membrane protein assembly factor BamC [Tatumella saanichensis]
MAYSVKKSAVAKAAGLSVVLLLSACSHDQHYKREINGNEDYLNAAGLNDLNVPSGMILPLESGQYQVPQASSQGATGKMLDIRPPAQPLALLNGSRTQFSGTDAVLVIQGTPSDIWSQVITSLQDKKVTIAERNDAEQQLSTDWINWNRPDEDQQYRGRYQVAVQQQSYQTVVRVHPLTLEQKGVAVTGQSEIQRYTAQLLNDISAEMSRVQAERLNNANNVSGSIDVQSGADDTGLPDIIVRAPFAATWDRLPAALKRAGMTVSDKDRSEGSLNVSYKALSSSDWDALGAKDPGLDNGKYKLQLGDLDNRSSLQFIDPRGHVLTQSQNDALVSVLQAAFNK